MNYLRTQLLGILLCFDFFFFLNFFISNRSGDVSFFTEIIQSFVVLVVFAKR